ncbi:hypothetical protein ABZT08_25575 [Streptomyces sp. NPDC005526]|uniref:hypothetical protein n=1 Tax=Streptomyces sp. NPDC005526 TaxID=3156885 RepID=UPI0033A04FC1
MPLSRPLTAATGTALLGIALVACTDQALGTITARNAAAAYRQVISNPAVGGCHRFAQGATHVDNFTQNDIILYQGDSCAEPANGQSTYLATQSSDNVVAGAAPWRSFTIVGR